MPQLEQTDTYLSQIFWLIVNFSLLYLLMRYVVIPRLRYILDARANQISSDLERASSARQDVIEVLSSYERRMSAAQNENEARVRDAFDAQAQMIQQESEKLQKELDVKFAESEARMQTIKQQALDDLEDAVQPLITQVLEKSSDGLIRTSQSRLLDNIRTQIKQ